MNTSRRGFLKWIGGISAIITAPKAEAIAKEVEKVAEPAKPKFMLNPFLAVYTSGGCVTGGCMGYTNYNSEAVYDTQGRFIGWK